MQRRATAAAVVLVVADAAVLVESAAPAWRTVTGTDWLAAHDADRLAGPVAQVGLFLAAIWLAVGLLAGAGSGLPGMFGRGAHAVHVRVLPAAVRRLIATTASAGVLLAPVSVAAAAPGHLDRPMRPPATVAAPSPVPPPVWPTTGHPGTAHPTAHPRGHPTAHPSGRAPAVTRRVTVAEGDSLWLIATRRLGPDADDARIAHYWPRVYCANRAVIGDDPDLIQPGRRLTLPTPARPAKETRR